MECKRRIIISFNFIKSKDDIEKEAKEYAKKGKQRDKRQKDKNSDIINLFYWHQRKNICYTLYILIFWKNLLLLQFNLFIQIIMSKYEYIILEVLIFCAAMQKD